MDNYSRIVYCKRCLTPSSRPRVVFNSEGYCNACQNSSDKAQVDWNARNAEFLQILDQHRSDSSAWDCIVPWSGGKDSSTIAWRLKFDFGMNPLLVTFSPMLPTEVGIHNRQQIIDAGFDAILFQPNQKVHRELSRRFFIERGNPKVAWDAGINVLPVSIASKFGIKLVFYAEHGESEYGGRVLSHESTRTRNFTEVIEHQIGDDPSNWCSENVTSHDLVPYCYPSAASIEQSGLKAYYFSYFNRWDMYENYKFIKDKIKFRTASRGRACGTFTSFDSLDDKFDDLYYYMQYVKFGFGRCVRDCSRFIQNGHISREQGLAYCKEYDGEFSEENFSEILEYLQMNKNDFWRVVDQHRNPEIWSQIDQVWTLRFPLV
jgi:N-acetyl sugar amidotransferase